MSRDIDIAFADISIFDDRVIFVMPKDFLNWNIAINFLAML